MADFALNSSPSAAGLRAEAKGFSIGLVGPLPPPFGGMGAQCQQLCELLRAEGIDVVFVQTNAPYYPKWIEKVRGVRALFRLFPYLVKLKRMCERVDVIHLLANSGWSWHLFGAPAVWIARCVGSPIIVNYRGGNAETFLQSAPWWVKQTLAAANSLITPSTFLQRVFRQNGLSADVIPNAVDLTRFRPNSEQRTRGQGHIIITRNLERIYGIDTALQAIAKAIPEVDRIRVTIAGEGPEKANLLKLTEDLGITDRVRFVGRLTRDEIADLYRNADVMLNPSTIDNMPNSILEAFATAVPVISTNVGGVPFIARDGETAPLVPPRDPTAMANAIVRLFKDDSVARSLAEKGRQEAVRYSWAEVRQGWLGLYASLRISTRVVPEV